jgi:hypothetical protein
LHFHHSGDITRISFPFFGFAKRLIPQRIFAMFDIQTYFAMGQYSAKSVSKKD